jgi:putative transposase
LPKWARVAAQRNDALHQVTTGLMRRADVIGFEDLNVAGLARGMHAKSIHDAAFSEFRRQLEYKAGWYGRTIVAVDRFFPSSKQCSAPGCGHVHSGLTLGDRDWTCPKCGTWHDRDANAARNIHEEALRVVTGRDVRYEPLGESSGDMCVEARGACPGDRAGCQVLADEARSGQVTEARLERAAVT